MRLCRSGLEHRPRRCAPEDRCRRRAPGQSRSCRAADLARSRPSRGSEGARVLREWTRPRIQSRSWRSAVHASGKRGRPGRCSAGIEPEISLTGGKTQSWAWIAPNDLYTMLPVEPHLTRSFEDLPGEVCSPLICQFISMRPHFEQRENFLAEV